MIRLRIKPDLYEIQRYESLRDELDRWVFALAQRGYEVQPEDVYVAWGRHSEANCAGWLVPYGDDDDDCNALLRYLEPCDIV